MKKLPIGISDFKSLIEDDDYYYIDKTDFIKEIIDSSAIAQIADREYVSGVQKRGYNNILSFGVVFDGKRVWVKR